MIVYDKLRKLGDDYILIVPDEVVEQLGLKEGDQVEIRLEPINEADIPEDMSAAFEESLKRSEKAYRYLSGR